MRMQANAFFLLTCEHWFTTLTMGLDSIHDTPPLFPLERPLHEVRQVIANLGQVPLRQFLVPALVQAIKFGQHVRELLELQLSLFHVSLHATRSSWKTNSESEP